MMSLPILTISSQLGREPLPVTGEPQAAYLLIDIQANEAATPIARSPLNLCLVLDRSGSMRGPRMNAMKDALLTVIDTLTPEDVLSVVTYDDMVDLVVPAQHVEDRESLKAAISIIEDGGGTAMSLGMSLGLAELHKYAADHVSRMILLTDGMTRGDEQQCLQLAEAAAHECFSITPLGIGAEWDDEFLEQISARSGGTPPEYIRTPTELAPAFVHGIEAASATAQCGVQLTIRFVAGVTPRRVTRVAPFIRTVDAAIEEQAVTVLLGDVEHGLPQRLLVELLIEPKRGGTFRIAQIEATSGSHPEQSALVRADVVVPFSASASKRPQIRPVVLHYIERATAIRLIQRALENPETKRAPLSPNIARLFDREGRELLEAFWSGAPLSPEGRKTLNAKLRDLTRLRRAS